MTKLIKCDITDKTWSARRQNLIEKMLPYQWEALNDNVEGAEPSGSIHDLKLAAKETEGEFIGPVFIDSDIAKYLEAAAYSLEFHPDSKLEESMDGVIDLLGRVQEEDGYLNSAFITKDREKRLTNLRDWHELYVAGHMLEAAVAYFRATGKDKFLDIMKKNVAYFMDRIGEEEGKLRGYPGHEEIELALVKLYEACGEEKYLDFAKYMIDERGKKPNYFEEEYKKLGFNEWSSVMYNQAHKPVREQKEAAGHSVRAGYLYTAMADIARISGETELLDACETLFNNIADKQMYITGGIGSCAHGEEFSFNYDLPNDTVYAETCAAISLVFFAKRMLKISAKAKYADVMERALYNGVMSGVSLEGTEFFYVNPLELWPEQAKRNRTYRHVKTVRQPWFGCACCPPNLARLLASLSDYIYTPKDDGVQVDLYIAGDAVFDIGKKEIKISQKTDYPQSGKVKITVSEGEYALYIRIPEWSRGTEVAVNGKSVSLDDAKDGYLTIENDWQDGDVIEADFNIAPRFVAANPKVRADFGKAALMYGPLVYCIEEADNGSSLYAVSVDTNAPIKAQYEADTLGGVTLLYAKGYRAELPECDALYTDVYAIAQKECELCFIPYYAFANRGEGEMAVWVTKKQ